MKKKAEKIRKKYDFYPMTRMIKNIKIKKKETDTEMDEGTNNASIDEGTTNDIDDSETVVYASQKRESEDETDEKNIKNQCLKLLLRLKNKL